MSTIITFFLLMIPELILPGIVSSHFSPRYLLVLIFFLAWLHAFGQEGDRPEESQKFRAISRNILNVILFIVAAMLILSLYKMSIWEIAVTTAFSLGLVIATEKMLVEEEK